MSSPRQRLVAALKFALGLAVLVGVVWWLVPSGDELRAALARAEPRPAYFALVFVATFLASVVTSSRWQRMAESMGGTRLPYVAYFHSLVLTRVLGQVSSTLVMDLVGRGVALRAAGSQRGLGHAIAQATLERIFDLVLPVMLLGWAALAWRGGWSGPLVLGSFAGVCLVFTGLAALLLAPLTRLALRAYAAAARLRRRAQATEVEQVAAGPLEVRRQLALEVGALSLLRYLSVMLQFWAVAAALGVDLSFFQIAAATPVGQLAGMMGLTPGALGIQEAGWVGGFKWVGVDDASIALFVLSQRFIITAGFGLLALASWPLLRRARRAAPPAA